MSNAHPNKDKLAKDREQEFAMLDWLHHDNKRQCRKGLGYINENGLNATYNFNYSGDLYANNANSVKVNSYTVSNFRLSYQINKGDWSILPYMGMNNIFDTEFNSNIRINAFGSRYYEPAPGRNSYLGITFTRSM